MISEEAGNRRQDRAVIMARGLSARMGVPKGLLRLSPTGPAFVRIIADLYRNAGLPVDVVTRAETAEDYRSELADGDDIRILPADAGGDTALTLLYAWRSCLAAGLPCSHFWAHPVDLPLVSAVTVERMMDHSQGNPDRIIRPVRQGTPGHPVILPLYILDVLDRQEPWQGGPLRDFLSYGGEQGLFPGPVTVEVEDVGIVRDFDRPGDFSPDQSSEQKRGAP